MIAIARCYTSLSKLDNGLSSYRLSELRPTHGRENMYSLQDRVVFLPSNTFRDNRIYAYFFDEDSEFINIQEINDWGAFWDCLIPICIDYDVNHNISLNSFFSDTVLSSQEGIESLVEAIKNDRELNLGTDCLTKCIGLLLCLKLISWDLFFELYDLIQNETHKGFIRIAPCELNDDCGVFWLWMRDKYLHLNKKEDIRPIQKEVIKGIELRDVKKPNNFLTIIPTGGGKSAIFQAPILYKAIVKKSTRLSLVITPLQALMKDQVNNIVKKDSLYKTKVDYLHAGRTEDEYRNIIKRIRSKELSLLYITPERLMNQHFWDEIIEVVESKDGPGFDTIVFDEAHCVVSWGLDFRPDYISALRKCVQIQKRNPYISIQLYSATIPARDRLNLISEICIPEEHFFPKKNTIEYAQTLYPIKNNIKIRFQRVYTAEEGSRDRGKTNLEAKCEYLRRLMSEKDFFDTDLLHGSNPQSRMIVFVRRIEETKILREFLSDFFKGTELENKIGVFHSEVGESSEKDDIVEKFKTGVIVILIATKAFGMGMDIRNIHCVIHFSPPQFLEDYLQEVGRAARDNDCLESFFRDGRTNLNTICLYTESDLDFNAPEEAIPKKEVSWYKIIDSYNSIRQYLNDGYHKRLNKGFFPIPTNLLEFSNAIRTEEIYDLKVNSKGKTNENLEETFYNCINWLSKSSIVNGQDAGLNRIEVGFKCPRYYEVDVNPSIVEIKTNDHNLAHFYQYARKKWEEAKDCSVMIDAFEVLSDTDYQFDGRKSNKDVEDLINLCYEHHAFLRDHSRIRIALSDKCRKATVRDFDSTDDKDKTVLPDLEIIYRMLKVRHREAFPQFDEEVFDELKKDLRNEDVSINGIRLQRVKKAWMYFHSLSFIYSPEEIKRYCAALVRALQSQHKRHYNWKELAKDSGLELDPDALKVFVIALRFLGYTTNYWQLWPRQYIQIRLKEDRDILEDPPTDSADRRSKEQIYTYYDNKYKRTKEMRQIVQEFIDHDKAKSQIISYFSSC